MAGESAGDYAQRLRDKAARLERSAQMWERGAEGEKATAAALNELKAHGWTTFHDVRWPGRPRANIDHIAVGPGGVFVIDSKNWSGDVRVVGDILYQGSRRREREVAAAAEAGLAVTTLLQGLAATPVLCFVREEQLEGWARDVMVCSTASLAARLTAQPPILGPESLRRVIGLLQWHLSSAGSARSVAPPIRAPRRRPPRGRSPIPWSRLIKPIFGIVLIAVGLALGMAVLSNLNSLVDGLGSGGSGRGSTDGAAPSVPALGETVRVEASSSHPELEITADKVVRVRTTRPDYVLQKDHHLVGVRYAIRNLGSRLWGASSPRFTFSGLASNGDHVSRGHYGSMPAKKLIPEAFNLRPGHERHGYVILSVPDHATLVRASVGFGFGASRSAEWLIP